ncbi:hypothetical protein L484_017318 [Morus notabilis]|uniref:Uncharacterized protein n=1 Tax=Morus notabilis TaxID=981085 RepID=W9SHD8_9ROSA|nr:hypothetical protein L484_017318 [Morus notabilis]
MAANTPKERPVQAVNELLSQFLKQRGDNMEKNDLDREHYKKWRSSFAILRLVHEVLVLNLVTAITTVVTQVRSLATTIVFINRISSSVKIMTNIATRKST